MALGRGTERELRQVLMELEGVTRRLSHLESLHLAGSVVPSEYARLKELSLSRQAELVSRLRQMREAMERDGQETKTRFLASKSRVQQLAEEWRSGRITRGDFEQHKRKLIQEQVVLKDRFEKLKRLAKAQQVSDVPSGEREAFSETLGPGEESRIPARWNAKDFVYWAGLAILLTATFLPFVSIAA